MPPRSHQPGANPPQSKDQPAAQQLHKAQPGTKIPAVPGASSSSSPSTPKKQQQTTQQQPQQQPQQQQPVASSSGFPKYASVEDFVSRVEIYRGRHSVVWNVVCKATKRPLILKGYVKV